jgi:hypothetical protein
MKKVLLLLVALSFTAVITGCHASADVDPHGATSVSLPR